MKFFCDFFGVIASFVIVLAWLIVTLTEERKKKKKERKSEDRQFAHFSDSLSGTSAMFSSKFNGPIAHENTQ